MAARTWSLALLATGSALAACDADADFETGQLDQAITATTQTESFGADVESSFQNLGGINIIGIEPVTLTIFDLHVAAQAKWIANIDTEVTWDSDKVRQGQELEVARKASASQPSPPITQTLRKRAGSSAEQVLRNTVSAPPGPRVSMTLSTLIIVCREGFRADGPRC